jgi:hypothetical protein
MGPDLPEPTSERVPPNPHRHSLPIGYRVIKRSVLGGLHHEYGLEGGCVATDLVFAPESRAEYYISSPDTFPKLDEPF